MYGAPDATFLVLSAAALDQKVINALDSAARALGHSSGACVATLAEAAPDIALFVATADPWTVVAIDEEAVAALALAFSPQAAGFAADEPVSHQLGYTLVAVPGFADCLDDLEFKRIAWGRLQAAAHPSNPLGRAKPSSGSAHA